MKRIFSVLMSIVIVLSCVVFIMPPNIVLAASYTWPVDKSIAISSAFGSYSGHTGCDFACSIGHEVYAVADGTVVTATDSGCTGSHRSDGYPKCSKGTSCPATKLNSNGKGSYANWIIINHGSNVYSLYAHLSTGSFKVKVGDKVKQGQNIAKTGSAGNVTGPHLHFEMRVGGNSTNYAKNPTSYLSRKNVIPDPDPPTYSNFWVDHYLFDLSETVSFTAVASGADNYTIGIDKTGVGRVVTEGCGSTYTISADRLGAGEYSAYMTVANSAGYVDTYRVYFVVAEKCNFGDKFSARIQNIGTGCYITNKDSKIVGAPESGYNNQIWFFNKYSDGSYTIMSQLDGLMMDVSYIDDPPAGADVHAWESTGKWNQRFNIYYLDDAFYIRPANTKTLVVDMGAGEPYNVACYNLSRNAGQQKYRFDMVGMGDYIPYGLGDEFYAQLRCQGTNLYVTNQSGNVAGTAATADDSQIWKFMRQSNGAYVIQNTLDGSYIDVENSNDANKTNFLSYNEYTGNRNQQFYFYEMDNAFYIKPLISNTRVMDMQSTAPYNVALWDKGNDWGPQKFDVIKVSHSDDNMSKTVETSYFKGHKYELYNESMTWESAKLFCEKKGGHLVTISDEKENEFVNGMRCRNLSTDYQQSIWLGGSDTANEGTWSWITGEAFTYSNWEPNEPNGGTTQNYLQMYSSGNWDDVQNETGRFVVCEYDSVQPKLTPVASSLSLSDNIGFNIYMQISDDVLSDDGALMIITNSDGNVIKKPISSYETTTYQDKSVKKIVSMVPAAKMSGKLSFKILKSDGTESSTYICSVMDYANEMIKKADTDAECKKALPLVKAMLNYGAYSQIYFGEDKTNLVNAILKDDNTATIKSEDIIKSITYSEQGLFSNKDLEYMGSSLICESDISLKLYFNNKNKLTEKQIKGRYDISTLDKNKHDYDTGVDGSIFWIKIKGIKPAELGNVYGVNLVSDDVSVIVETSPYVYVKKALESGDSRLQNLCKAMWAYGQAAREYEM